MATWGWTGWNDAPRRLCRAGDRRGGSCQGRDGGRSLLSGRRDGNRVGAAAQQGRRLSILSGLWRARHVRRGRLEPEGGFRPASIGRASGRESVCKSGSVPVVAATLKKK